MEFFGKFPCSGIPCWVTDCGFHDGPLLDLSASEDENLKQWLFSYRLRKLCGFLERY